MQLKYARALNFAATWTVCFFKCLACWIFTAPALSVKQTAFSLFRFYSSGFRSLKVDHHLQIIKSVLPLLKCSDFNYEAFYILREDTEIVFIHLHFNLIFFSVGQWNFSDYERFQVIARDFQAISTNCMWFHEITNDCKWI